MIRRLIKSYSYLTSFNESYINSRLSVNELFHISTPKHFENNAQSCWTVGY